jgi:plastocyanin
LTRHMIRLVCPTVMAGAMLAACGGGTSSAGPEPAGVASNAATVKNFAFSPTPLTVRAGTTVTWTNQDSSVHTVTAVDRSFDSGNVPQGRTFTHRFSAAGTYAYRCNIHQYMTGSVVVQG